MLLWEGPTSKYNPTNLPGHRYGLAELILSNNALELINHPDVVIPVTTRVQLGVLQDRRTKLKKAYEELISFYKEDHTGSGISAARNYSKFYDLLCHFSIVGDLTVDEINEVEKLLN